RYGARGNDGGRTDDRRHAPTARGRATLLDQGWHVRSARAVVHVLEREDRHAEARKETESMTSSGRLLTIVGAAALALMPARAQAQDEPDADKDAPRLTGSTVD